METETSSHVIANSTDQAIFIFGGKAVFTLRSKRTGVRFTYSVKASKDGKVFFASVLTGSNNETDYTYMGIIPADNPQGLRPTAKSRITPAAPSFRALAWALGHLGSADMELFHEGRCCRCARRLTDPESITLGIGPECRKTILRAA